MKKKLLRLQSMIVEVERSVEAVAKESQALKEMLTAWQMGDSITYSTLDRLAYYEPLPIGDGVTSYKIPSRRDELTFVVVFKANGHVKDHVHDCKELMIRLDGEIAVNGEQVDKELMVDINKHHQLFSEEGSILIVHFEKPN